MAQEFDSTNIEQFKVFKFTEGTCYYGEIVWVDSAGKIIEDISSFPEDEKKQRVRHGSGIEIYGKTPQDEVSRYEGQWDRDKKSGRGKCVFPDGSYYIGEYRNDCFSGKGIYTWSNGAVYEGEWLMGRMSGYGEYKNSNVKRKGTFINGYYLDVIFFSTYLLGDNEEAAEPALGREGAAGVHSEGIGTRQGDKKRAREVREKNKAVQGVQKGGLCRSLCCVQERGRENVAGGLQ